MITDKRRRAVVTSGLLLLGGGVGAALALLLVFTFGSGHVVETNTATGRLGEPDTSFRISGDATTSMGPGERIPLDLTLSNTQGAPMVVTGLTVTVLAVDAPNASAAHPCTTGDFSIAQVHSGFRAVVGSAVSRSLRELGVPLTDLPQLGMRDAPVNQDGCKGASLTLSYSATGGAGSE